MTYNDEKELDNFNIDKLNEILISKQQILHKIKRQLNALPISNIQIYNKPEQQLKHIILILNSKDSKEQPFYQQGEREEMLKEKIQQFHQKLIEQENKLQKLTKEKQSLEKLNKQLRFHGFNNLLIDCKERLQDIEDQIEKQHKQDTQITELKRDIKEKEEEKSKLQIELQQIKVQTQALARQYEVEEQVLRSQMTQKTEKRQENINSKYQTDEKNINDLFARQLNEQEQQLSSLEEKYMDLEKKVKDNNEEIEKKEQTIQLLQTEINKVSWEINGALLQRQFAMSVFRTLQMDVEVTQSRVDTLNTVMYEIEEMINKITQIQEDAIIDLSEMQLFMGQTDI